MNQTQLKHIRQRLDEATAVRVDRANEKLGKEPASTLTDEQKVDAIYAGRAKRKPRKEIDARYTDLADAYTYPQEKDMARARAKWDVQRQKLHRVIYAAKEKLLDQIILGDMKDALAMIAAFESGK